MIDPNLIDRKNWEEHYIRRGDPTKPTYYIIRRESKTSGLADRYTRTASHIWYALTKGCLPVVDMQNYPNPYLAPEKLGVENSWEYYFEQPLRIGLEEAYAGENIILCDGKDSLPRPSTKMEYYENKDDVLTEWRMFPKLGLLKIKPAIYEEILATKEKLFSPNERVLAVLLRGTDYVAKRPRSHAITPPPEFALSMVAAKLKEWNCNKFFLATEDKTIVEKCKENFREQCIILDRVYVDFNPKTDKSIGLSRIDRENDHFLQGKDYLTQMMLLTMCNSFVAARCGGSYAVMMMTDRFEHTYFFDLGRYGRYGV